MKKYNITALLLSLVAMPALSCLATTTAPQLIDSTKSPTEVKCPSCGANCSTSDGNPGPWEDAGPHNYKSWDTGEGDWAPCTIIINGAVVGNGTIWMEAMDYSKDTDYDQEFTRTCSTTDPNCPCSGGGGDCYSTYTETDTYQYGQSQGNCTPSTQV